LEPRRRIDQALYAVMIEAYVQGVSTRAVDDLVETLGTPSGINKSEVSRICTGLDETVGAFRTRHLDHIEFPSLPGRQLPARPQPHRSGCSIAVVIATGISATGEREVLGVDVSDSEDEVFWRGFLRDLRQRSLDGIRLVISDQHAGLVAALAPSVPGRQPSTLPGPLRPQLAALDPRSHHDMVAAVFRTIFAQPDSDTVASMWDQIRHQLADRLPKIGPLMDDAKAEVLALCGFVAAIGPRSGQPTPRAVEQRSQGPRPRRGHLPQRSRGDPPRPRRAR
jgi:transposase-like protein